jgi:hypothetical protein
MASRNSHRLARRWRRLGGEAVHKEQQRRRKRNGKGGARGRTIGEAGLGPDYMRYLIHPTVQIKRVLIDSSDI